MRRTLLAVLGALGLLLGSTGVATAQDEVSVDVKPHGKLLAGGDFAEVTVRIACPASPPVLEAFVFIQQDSSGQGGIPGLICDGRERKYTVRVQATDPGFVRGPATFSGFVLLCDDVHECIQGQETTTGKLTGG